MSYKPLVGKQLDSCRLATARWNIWEGSVRSSKTISSLIAWLEFVRHGPPGNLLMFGKTERTLKRNIIDPLEDMLGKKRCKLNSGAGELWLLGRRIYTAGANDERSVDKLKGLTLVGIYGDELTTAPESFFAMADTRLSLDGSRGFGTTNPEGPQNWLLQTYLKRAALHLDGGGNTVRRDGDDALDLHRFSFRLTDNPHLPPAYLESLERTHFGLWRKRYILGEWALAEGAIFDMFAEARHVVDEVPLITRWIGLGVDHGTTNPFAAMLLGLGVDRKLYFVNEWRWDSRRERRQLSNVEYSERLRGWLADLPHPGGSQTRGVRPEYTVVDPSAADFLVQLHRDGLTPIGANNEVLPGIQRMSSLFATNQLLVSRDCKGFLEEIPAYAWDSKKAAKGEDAPIKVGDHSVDAGRYAVHTTESAWLHQLARPQAA